MQGRRAVRRSESSRTRRFHKGLRGCESTWELGLGEVQGVSDILCRQEHATATIRLLQTSHGP